jgi:hypothetical protein
MTRVNTREIMEWIHAAMAELKRQDRRGDGPPPVMYMLDRTVPPSDGRRGGKRHG